MMKGRWLRGLVLGLMPLVPEAMSAPVPARLDPDGVQRLEVVGGSYFFRPDHIVVKAGVPVELTVSREPGLVPHSLVIWSPRMGIDVEVTLNSLGRVIRFTPESTGQTPFYCREKLLFFAGHRARGMAGIMEVVE
ncbi:quinol oxidase [Oceanimonas pelagia]|uniref:Quinol oxidase n=1 Tax=Oceanimonas pelagia TaxID=3028314 RepID=A0AA50KRE4_9GAMM|nr:quinol oxidase [Oceanimonas pelagia]WMC11690.1 quinol oxidase [Oceanimonas pelagia]